MEQKKQDNRARLDQASRKLFSQVGFFTANPSLGKFTTYKEFKKHLSRPTLNYHSESVKDILNSRSKIYSDPNKLPKPNNTSKLDSSFSVVHPTLLTNVDPSTVKMTLSPLKYPQLLPEIIDNMDVTKSACYNFKTFVQKRFHSVKDYNIEKQGKSVQKMKAIMQQNFIQRFLAKRLKDGQTIFKKYDPMDEKLNFKDDDFQFEPTNAELDRYRDMQLKYLMSLKEMDIDIPQDKMKLYKILVEKNYSEHPLKDEKKKGLALIKSMLTRQVTSNSITSSKDDIIKDQDRKKMMVQAAKKFKIDNHARNIFKEDKEYLLDLNRHIEDQIKYRNNPSKQRVSSSRNKPAIVLDSNMTSVKPTDRIHDFQKELKELQKSKTETPTQKKKITITNMKKSNVIKKSSTHLDKYDPNNKAQDRHNDPISKIIKNISLGFSDLASNNQNNTTQQNADESPKNVQARSTIVNKPKAIQLQNIFQLGHAQNSSQVLPSNRNSKFKDQGIEGFKNDSRHFINQLYKKSEITRNNSNTQLMKKQNLDQQFSFYLNSISTTQMVNPTEDERRSRNEVFIAQNRFLPYGTFSYKKLTDEDRLISNTCSHQIFQPSSTAIGLESELLQKVVSLSETLDKTTVMMTLMKSDENDLQAGHGSKLIKANLQQKYFKKVHDELY